MQEFSISAWHNDPCDHEMEEQRRRRMVRFDASGDEIILIVEDVIKETCCHCSQTRKQTEKVRKERLVTETIETFK